MAMPKKHNAAPRTPEQNRRLTIFIIAAVLCAGLIVGLIFGISGLLADPADDGLILPNVIAGGINLGGMTPEEATNALQLSVADPLTRKDLTVELPGTSLTLAPADTKVQLDVAALVESAYSYGRTGSAREREALRAKAETTPYILPLLPYLELDKDHILAAAQAFCDSYSIEISQPSAVISGDRPSYTPPDADGNPSPANDHVTHQVLTIHTGTPQFLLEAGDLYDAILDAYSLLELKVRYQAPNRIEPEALDLQALFDSYCIEPEDAQMDEKTYQITPEVVGYGFDVEAVQALIDQAGYGQELTISLDFLLPDITERSFGVLFQDVLASFTSTADSEGDTYNRDKNLELSCEAINGTVVKPGEVFDFNKILGPRTSEKGYLSAPDYTGSTTSSIGGGISQTASALHYCALLSGLQIDERHTHTYAVEYTPLGTDAAIRYGKQNLIFTNSSAEPIRILASAKGGQVTIQLLGTETRAYKPIVESDIIKTLDPETIYQSMSKDNVYGYENGQVLQAGHTGYTIEVYYCRYDSETNTLIGRDLLCEVKYDKCDELVVRIGTVETKPPETTAPTVPSDPSGSTDPTDTTAPTDSTSPTEETP